MGFLNRGLEIRLRELKSFMSYVGGIRLAQPAGIVGLREEQRLGRTGGCFPLTYSALQGVQFTSGRTQTTLPYHRLKLTPFR